MTGRCLCSICLVLAVLLSAGSVRAADLSVFVGGVIPGSVEYQGVDTSLDNSPVYGFRFSSDFVPHFGMEHTLAFSSDYLFPKGIAAVHEAKGVLYNSNLMVNFPIRVNRAIPYITAGIGFIHQYGSANLPVGTRFAANYGGGLKFPRLAGPVGLRFDVRGYRVGSISNKLNLFEISSGVMLSLGR